MTSVEPLLSPNQAGHQPQSPSSMLDKQQSQNHSLPSPEQLLDLAPLSFTLPDLTLNSIHRRLSLDLGPTDLSVTLGELQRSSNKPLSSSSPTAHQDRPDPSPLSYDPHDRSRRWTGLSELGKSVVRGSASTYRPRSLQRPSADGPVSSSRNRSSHPKSGTSSLYSVSTRHRLNLFKLWSHDPTSIRSPPNHQPSKIIPSNSTLPILPPMSELLDESVMFDKDLGSMVDPIIAQDCSPPTQNVSILPSSSESTQSTKFTPLPSSPSHDPTVEVDLPISSSNQAQEIPNVLATIDAGVKSSTSLNSPPPAPDAPTFQGPRHSESSPSNSKVELPTRGQSMSKASRAKSMIKVDDDILSRLPKQPPKEEVNQVLDEPSREENSGEPLTNKTITTTIPVATLTPIETESVTGKTTTNHKKSDSTTSNKSNIFKSHHSLFDTLKGKKKSHGFQSNFFKLLFAKGFGQKSSHPTNSTRSSST